MWKCLEQSLDRPRVSPRSVAAVVAYLKIDMKIKYRSWCKYKKKSQKFCIYRYEANFFIWVLNFMKKKSKVFESNDNRVISRICHMQEQLRFKIAIKLSNSFSILVKTAPCRTKSSQGKSAKLHADHSVYCTCSIDTGTLCFMWFAFPGL